MEYKHANHEFSAREPAVAYAIEAVSKLPNLRRRKREPAAAYSTETVSIHEAKTNLSKLVKRAAAGETIYIGAYGKPEAAIVSSKSLSPKRPVSEAFGCMRGKMHLPEGWDDPLPDDIIESFYSMQGLEDFVKK